MKGGKRALTPWNIFVKKVFREGKAKNSSYAFKDALRDASKRKGEMGSSSSETKKMGKSKNRRRKGTRKHHTRRRRN
jgi:hypothetical protein